MAVKYKAKDYQYSQKTDVQDYLGSFDINNDDIDFDNLADYDDSDYVLNANILTRIATDVDEIQDDFHEEVDEQLTEDEMAEAEHEIDTILAKGLPKSEHLPTPQ